MDEPTQTVVDGASKKLSFRRRFTGLVRRRGPGAAKLLFGAISALVGDYSLDHPVGKALDQWSGAEARLDQRFAETKAELTDLGVKLTAQLEALDSNLKELDNNLAQNHQETKTLQMGVGESLGSVQGGLGRLESQHREHTQSLSKQHVRLQADTEAVHTRVAGVYDPLGRANNSLQSLDEGVEYVRQKLNVLFDGAFPSREELAQLRNEVLQNAAQADRSPQVVILRPGETSATDFEILQKSMSGDGYDLQNYRIEFTAEKAADPCSLRVLVSNHSGDSSPQSETVNGLQENEKRALTKAPFTVRLLYVKHNIFHKDLLVLAVAPDTRSG